MSKCSLATRVRFTLLCSRKQPINILRSATGVWLKVPKSEVGLMRNFMFVITLFFLATFSSDCWSQTVEGKRGTSPVDSMVSPASPTTDDLISFDLTADGITYSNQCVQLSFFGGAAFEIIVDEPSRSIEIGVTGTHSGFCLADYVPFNGLEGSVGPLAAGDWEIRTSIPGASPPLSFTVVPAPPTVRGISGTSAVDSVVFPASPTTDDLISFNLTADGITHGNQCGQLSAFGGTAFEIIVDEPSRSIQIGVTGPSLVSCPENYDPVNGLEGSVGQLAAGDWEIEISIPGASPPFEPFAFTVVPATVLLGDVNRNGVVDFQDIPPFIDLLIADSFLAEADCNQDGVVSFSDIPVFIGILIEQQ